DLLVLLGGAAYLGPLMAYAQQPRAATVGVLLPNRLDKAFSTFANTLHELGYEDDRNLQLIIRRTPSSSVCRRLRRSLVRSNRMSSCRSTRRRRAPRSTRRKTFPSYSRSSGIRSGPASSVISRIPAGTSPGSRPRAPNLPVSAYNC